MVEAGRGGPVGVWEGQSGPSWGCPGSKSGKKGKIAVFHPWSATDPKRGDAGVLEVWGSSHRVRGKVLWVGFACGEVLADTWGPSRRDLKGCKNDVLSATHTASVHRTHTTRGAPPARETTRRVGVQRGKGPEQEWGQTWDGPRLQLEVCCTFFDHRTTQPPPRPHPNLLFRPNPRGTALRGFLCSPPSSG